MAGRRGGAEQDEEERRQGGRRRARRQMINPNIASPPLYHKLDITSTRSPPAVIRLVNQA